jgi:hypothetical protein
VAFLMLLALLVLPASLLLLAFYEGFGTEFFAFFCSMEGSEQNSERFSFAKRFGMKFLGTFSSTEWFGTEFRIKRNSDGKRTNFRLLRVPQKIATLPRIGRKNNFRFELKRTETQSVSVVFGLFQEKSFWFVSIFRTFSETIKTNIIVSIPTKTNRKNL